jgi:hypothetical protein
MNSIRILFDGIEQNLDDFNGTQSISFSFRKETTTGESGKSFAPELDVRGNAFSYLYTNLISQPNPGLASVDVTVFDTCCRNPDGSDRLLFTGEVKGSDVRWCETESGIESCSMTITVIDNSADADALTCLKNLFPWERKDKFDGSGLSDGILSGRPPAVIPYCVDVRPNFLQEIILILGFLAIFVLYPIALIVGTLVTVVNFIIFLLSLGQFGPIQQVNFIDDALAVVNRLEQIIVGCGRRHVAPYVYSYLTNMCDICGLGLNSSIFDFGGDYHNTVRLDAAFRPGERTILSGSASSGLTFSFLANRPNINGVQFLDSFKQFNIDWRVSNGVLYVERKDFEFGGLWFDETTLPDNSVIEKCFEPLDDAPFAFAEYSYAKDGIDNTGDETNPDWTKEAIDWNVPPNPIQSGLFSRTFTFSTAQFRNDSGRDDESALDKPLYNTLYPALSQFRGVMLMERGICAFPRLLQIDPNSDPLDARVLRYPSIFPDLYDYNTDWWVRESYTDGTGTARDTLYNRFLFLDDPRTTGIKTRNYSITLNADCDLVRGINLDSFIRISQGGTVFDGSVETIDYNVTQNTITVTGKI